MDWKINDVKNNVENNKSKNNKSKNKCCVMWIKLIFIILGNILKLISYLEIIEVEENVQYKYML